MIEDMSFKEGQTIWLLETSNSYRKTPKECIRKCVYREKNGYNNDSVQLLINGRLGMTKGIGDGKLFETLEELKSYVIGLKINYVSNLQKEINDINVEIDEIKSIRDISEDRDKKLNTLLKWN
jgi:hypothetical protein